MSSLLTAENLTRYYGPHCAVDHLNFALEKGDVLGFLGPNGAGKSTTMQMLTGNLAPSKGDVFINGYNLKNTPFKAKASLGYLPAKAPLYTELTVDEYLRYCAQLHQLSPKQSRQRLQEIKDSCGLLQSGKKLIGNLSKGFQQRVGIAQALLHQPKVIILDEPTTGLDPRQVHQIIGLIKQLSEQHSIILSTHILPEVIQTCNQVKIIHHGRMVFDDSIQKLQQQMHASALNVTTLRPLGHLAKLEAIPGVRHIERSSPEKLRIHFTAGSNPADQVAQVIVESGVGLIEMVTQKQTLEDLFLSLTQEHETRISDQ